MVFQMGSENDVPSLNPHTGSWGGDQTDKISDNFFYIFSHQLILQRGSYCFSRRG